MNKLNIEIRKELFALAEPQYQQFASSLIPGVENLIGVRVPSVRKLAKKIAKDGPLEYLEDACSDYFEEIMLQGMVIGQLKEDIEIVLEQVALFIPKISNWSICDSFCGDLKIVKSNKTRMWEFIEPYLHSDKTYDIRFGIVIILVYYIEEEYLTELFQIFNMVIRDDYYVKMAVAWAVSMCFVKYPEETMLYLEENKLDKETYNKSLQKIRESLKVDKDTKEAIKALKRK